MAFVTAFCTLLAVPYVCFGWDVLAIIVAGVLFSTSVLPGLGSPFFGGITQQNPHETQCQSQSL